MVSPLRQVPSVQEIVPLNAPLLVTAIWTVFPTTATPLDHVPLTDPVRTYVICPPLPTPGWSAQVTGPLKVPLKTSPPVSAMVKLPPEAKVADPAILPLVKAPVEKLTVPRLPVVKLIEVNSEPVSVRPALVPVRVPPTLP